MSQIKNKFLNQMAAHTIKGNNTGSTANPQDLTATQVTAELNTFTSLLQGVVPASGGGTTNFLRADGTWNAPGGGGGASLNFWSGNFDVSASWDTTTNSFVDPTVQAAGTFTETQNVGFGTVVREASNLPGITFTPTTSGSVYLVTFRIMQFYSGANAAEYQVTDGTAVVGTCGTTLSSGNVMPGTITGVYAPGVNTPVTLKVQIKSDAGTAGIKNGSLITSANMLEITLLQIQS